MAAFDFEDIRPYKDDEVDGILSELVADPEFLSAISAVRLPAIHRIAPPVARSLVRHKLKSVVKSIHSVTDFQMQVEGFMDRNLASTSSGLTTSGVDHLDPKRTYVFICNHRDIAMDPALCNLVLHRAGRSTFRIAIGDNLLSKPFAEKLMKLNKSFLVRRQIEGRRQRFLEFQKLSAYIRQSILADGESIWIAHREGRAKDGIDRTDPALLKMLSLSGPEDSTFHSRVKDLHLVPVAVSYEWDPCDRIKARELAAKARDGYYNKGELEDIQSLALGIQGWKGRIQVAFGDEIQGSYESADELAVEIDRQIIEMYQLQPSNLAAWRRLNGELPAEVSIAASELETADTKLDERMAELDSDEADFLLASYANPVNSRLALHQNPRAANMDQTDA